MWMLVWMLVEVGTSGEDAGGVSGRDASGNVGIDPCEDAGSASVFAS